MALIADGHSLYQFLYIEVLIIYEIFTVDCDYKRNSIEIKTIDFMLQVKYVAA